jgi:hypothetical protein
MAGSMAEPEGAANSGPESNDGATEPAVSGAS